MDDSFCSGIGGDRVIFKTPLRNYTVADIPQLLTDAGAPDAAAMLRLQLENDVRTVDAPGVETHVFYGYSVPTPSILTINGTSFDVYPTVTTADGDGAILVEGLRVLEKFRHEQKKPIKHYPMKGFVHGACAQSEAVHRTWLEILFRPSEVS